MEIRSGVIWKDDWLSQSETFVRDQMNSLEKWDFLKIGFHRTPQPLVEPDYTPYKAGFMGRALRLAGGTALFEKEYLKHIRESDATFIHAHFLSGGMNSISLSEKAGLPLITTLHNPRFSFERSRVPSSARALLTRRFRALSTCGEKFLAVSNHVAEAAVQAGLPEDRIEVLPVGTHLVPLESNVEPQGIIFVGRLIEMKGVRDLLHAVAFLPDSLRDVPITIVGDGPLRGELEEFAREKKLNVVFAGWLPSSAIPQLLAASQIFCAPSKTDNFGAQEGFGMVYLEAALQQLPCVAYSSGGVSDAIADGETGILVAEGEILELAKALEQLLRDSATRRKMGQRGRIRVETDFNLKFQSAKLEKIYLDI
ncbi:glycosyltransferase [Corynebacterium stationis]|uniref:glycosyltransferase n=1 Tax=Corynebacterium stationis TaxID=1705 RepID=UPI00273CF395|nr:glycosyltransferase [Corynebacterium stationis]WLP87112.1 glycosyltransferase [Corynebacterium stationis]